MKIILVFYKNETWYKLLKSMFRPITSELIQNLSFLLRFPTVFKL